MRPGRRPTQQKAKEERKGRGANKKDKEASGEDKDSQVSAQTDAEIERMLDSSDATESSDEIDPLTGEEVRKQAASRNIQSPQQQQPQHQPQPLHQKFWFPPHMAQRYGYLPNHPATFNRAALPPGMNSYSNPVFFRPEEQFFVQKSKSKCTVFREFLEAIIGKELQHQPQLVEAAKLKLAANLTNIFTREDLYKFDQAVSNPMAFQLGKKLIQEYWQRMKFCGIFTFSQESSKSVPKSASTSRDANLSDNAMRSASACKRKTEVQDDSNTRMKQLCYGPDGAPMAQPFPGVPHRVPAGKPSDKLSVALAVLRDMYGDLTPADLQFSMRSYMSPEMYHLNRACHPELATFLKSPTVENALTYLKKGTEHFT